VDGGQEPRVGHVTFEKRLLLDAHEPVQRVGVAGVAQRFLGPEVVSNQPRRHARRPGDVPDLRPVHAALGEQAQRRVPDPRAGRQVLG